MPEEYSRKQIDVLTTPMKRWNILCGVTGSGKSWIANLKVYGLMCDLKAGEQAIITGNTSTTLEKNVVNELRRLDLGINWLTFTQGQITTRSGGIVHCIGVNNSGAENRIQGGSVRWVYMDEPTTYPKSGFDMLSSRARSEADDGYVRPMPILMTLNPDDELHYIKTDLIDRGGDDTNYWQFSFSDNPRMSQELIDTYRNQYTGAFLMRMVEGKWVGDPEKKIIPEFDDACEKRVVCEWPRPTRFHPLAALDPGVEDFTAYLVGYYDFKAAKVVIEGEWVGRQKTTQEITEAIKALEAEIFPGMAISARWSDTSSQLIMDICRLHDTFISATRKDEKEAQLNNLRVLFVQGKIIINPRCKTLIRHLKSGQWNANKTSFARTDHDGHYDCIDALMYFIRNVDMTTNPYPETDFQSGVDAYVRPVVNLRAQKGISRLVR
jgi:PBSX family phage terminase large subunit